MGFIFIENKFLKFHTLKNGWFLQNNSNERPGIRNIVVLLGVYSCSPLRLNTV